MLFTPPTYPSEEVKLKLGGRWNKDAKAWRVAPTSLNVLKLVEWYGDGILDGAPDEVIDLARESWGFRRFTEDELATAQAHPSWDRLYDVQREGAEYLYANPHGAGLVGLSWGLGKAAVSIVAADLLDARRVLVLAPLTLAPAWVDEFRTWARDASRPVKRATAADRAPGDDGVTIANHEVIQELVLRDEDGNVIQPDWVTNAKRVKAWIAEGPTKRDPKSGKTVPQRERIVRVRRDYADVAWDLIIVDESVMLKNRKAVKADVLMQLRKRSDPFVFLLSASPTTKYRDDLFKQLQVLYPRAFTSYWRFADMACVVDREGWGWSIEGDRPDFDPQHYLRDLMWIKSEDDAGIALPEYLELAIELGLDPGSRQNKALDQMLNEWIVELDGADPHETVVASNWLARSTRLQQITSNLGALPKPSGGFFKRESIKEDLLIDLLERGDLKPPLLVWSWYVETTHSIRDRLMSATDLETGSVIGSDTTKHKDATIAAYKAGELDALVLQMGVGKFGHTLTSTRGIYYHDRTFDSDAYVQSRRRVRRIGLKHRPMLIVPKIKSSADELIDANLEGKVRSIAQLTNASLADLLRSIRQDAS